MLAQALRAFNVSSAAFCRKFIKFFWKKWCEQLFAQLFPPRRSDVL